MLAEHHMFEHAGNTYLLHVDDMKAFKINNALSTEINAMVQAGTDLNSGIDEMMSTALHQLNLLDQNVREKVSAVTPKVPVTHVSLNISQSCNMDCIYCYGGGGEYGKKGNMRLDVAKATVDWLIAKSGTSNRIGVTFFGGEPLLNFEVLKEVVLYTRDRARDAGKEAFFSLTTNGTLLSPEVTGYLNENKISVVVSYDGDRAAMKLNRPLKQRSVSYEDVEKRVKEFVQSRNGNVTARATITKHNADLGWVRKSLLEMGFKRFRLVEAAERITDGGSAPNESGKTGFILDGAQQQRHLSQLEESALSVVHSIKNKELITEDELFSYMCRLHLRNKRYYFCGVGKGLVGVSLSGDVYPCHRFVGVEQMRMGHVNSGPVELKQEDYVANFGITHPVCSECWARFFCGGGCMYEHMQGSGIMEKPCERSCNRIRRLVELAIVAYAMLNEEDKKVVNGYATKERSSSVNQPRT
jgi:uncharacterized protein